MNLALENPAKFWYKILTFSGDWPRYSVTLAWDKKGGFTG